ETLLEVVGWRRRPKVVSIDGLVAQRKGGAIRSRIAAILWTAGLAPTCQRCARRDDRAVDDGSQRHPDLRRRRKRARFPLARRGVVGFEADPAPGGGSGPWNATIDPLLKSHN